jgi:hypothetical protein
MNPKNLTVKIERTPAQVELVKKLGSKNKMESMAAAEAIASILPAPILAVIEQAAIISSLYANMTYAAGEAPKIDLDPYFDVRNKQFVQVWSQVMAGGTATNFSQGLQALFVQTFPLTSACSLNKSTLRAANLDYLGKMLTKMAQEILVQREINGANILMASMAAAKIDFDKTNTAVTNLPMRRTVVADIFQPADFNNILTAYDRVVSSWVGGTPVEGKNGIDILLGSPEWMGQVRSMAYQPVNTLVLIPPPALLHWLLPMNCVTRSSVLRASRSSSVSSCARSGKWVLVKTIIPCSVITWAHSHSWISRRPVPLRSFQLLKRLSSV